VVRSIAPLQLALKEAGLALQELFCLRSQLLDLIFCQLGGICLRLRAGESCGGLIPDGRLVLAQQRGALELTCGMA
jgi:hypothetical protein